MYHAKKIRYTLLEKLQMLHSHFATCASLSIPQHMIEERVRNRAVQHIGSEVLNRVKPKMTTEYNQLQGSHLHSIEFPILIMTKDEVDELLKLVTVMEFKIEEQEKVITEFNLRRFGL